jgi:hypothetical protein
MIEYTGKFKVTDEYWTERSFVFEGTKGTEFVWPKDRIIAFRDGDDGNILVPTFDLLNPKISDDVESHIRQCIATAPTSMGKAYKKLHFHLVRIEDHPTIVAMFIDRKRRNPVKNFYAK